MVGPIEILPPHPVHTATSARVAATGPVAAADAVSGRRGPVPRPAEVVIDLDPAGNPKAISGAAAESGTQQHGQRRALPYHPSADSRRSPYATASADAAKKPSVREAGTLAYRAADGLIADYAHRGTFYDLKI
ncbi:MAG: hypothetical protein ACM3N5_04755 [Candidatus Eiseniibacteriota bacterium]